MGEDFSGSSCSSSGEALVAFVLCCYGREKREKMNAYDVLTEENSARLQEPWYILLPYTSVK